MAAALPVFRGYTVNTRLQRFRKTSPEIGAEFIETLDNDPGEYNVVCPLPGCGNKPQGGDINGLHIQKKK